MDILITAHARERMATYDISEGIVRDAIEKPDLVTGGHSGRLLYHKKLNGYVIRAVVEDHKGIKRVITVYKARSNRYGL